MKRIKYGKFWIFLLIFALFIPFMKPIQSASALSNDDLKITSKSAFLVDYQTGFVIYQGLLLKLFNSEFLLKLFYFINLHVIKYNIYFFILIWYNMYRQFVTILSINKTRRN